MKSKLKVMWSRCNWKILQVSYKIAARMLLTSQCEIAEWLFLLFPVTGKRCYHLVMLCQEGLKCVDPRHSPLAEMGEGLRGAEGWMLPCPLCTQSQLYPRGRWAGLLVLANEDGLTCVTKVFQRKRLKCDQQLIYPKFNDCCLFNDCTWALMRFQFKCYLVFSD